MDWSGQIEYAKADWKKFEVDGEEAGLTTGYGPLQFLKVLFLLPSRLIFLLCTMISLAFDKLENVLFMHLILN